MLLRRIIIAVSLIGLVITACSDGPPTPGELKDFSAICDKANNGKRVAVEGYLRFPSSFKISKSVVLRLYKDTEFKTEPIGVQIDMGNQANQVEQVPKQFTDKDLKVHLADGQVAEIGTKVRVSGKVYFPIVAQEFPCSLQNPLVELAK
jgi:hypothetical protein